MLGCKLGIGIISSCASSIHEHKKDITAIVHPSKSPLLLWMWLSLRMSPSISQPTKCLPPKLPPPSPYLCLICPQSRIMSRPIVYQRKGSANPPATSHVPAHHRFADPPLVYTCRSSETSITPTTPTSAALPDIGMDPSTSSAINRNSHILIFLPTMLKHWLVQVGRMQSV